MNKNSGIITICKKCEHCEPAHTWADPTTYWCKKSYRQRLDYIGGQIVVDKEYCKNKNTDGHCPLYDKK